VKDNTVRLVLLRAVKLTITGPVSGKTYSFSGAGSVVEVDEVDAPAMLAIQKGHSCCGNVLSHPMFQLA
jgi:hypothetical protein